MFAKIKNRKIVLMVLIAVVSVVMLAPQLAGALGEEKNPTMGNSQSTDNNPQIAGLALTITTSVGKILVLIAGLVDFAVKLGNDVLSLPAVTTGWGIVLQFTNLGFILGIIIIAFATILHLESYALKQILWKLIVAALLVNFSLVIAGAIMSISNIVSDYFIEAAMGKDGTNLSNALANAVNPQAFQLPSEEAGFWQKITNAMNLFFEFIAGLFFLIIFSFFIVLAFATLFVMLLVRVIALIFLIILSPIVWLLWIFPATQKYWQQWWQEFIRWNFFAPAVFFFIYLAIMTAGCMNINQTCAITGQSGKTLSSIEQAQKSESSAAKVFDKNTIMGNPEGKSSPGEKKGIFQHVANLFVVLGLLFGGIYVANKFGIAGGNIGMNLAQKVGKGAGAWAGRKGLGGLRGGYSRLAGAAKWGDKSVEASEKAAKSGRFGKMWYGLKARTLANLSAPAEREPERYKNEVSKLTMTQAMAQLSSDSILMPGGRKVALNEHVINNLPKVNIPGGRRREEIMEDIIEDKVMESMVRDNEGNFEKISTTQKVKTGERGTGKYKDVSMDDKAKQDWLEKNLVLDSMKNLYARSKMDFTAVEKKVGVSNEMINARKIHGVDSMEFATAAKKFYGGLKKSDAGDVGKALKRIYSTPFTLRDSDEKTLAKQISIALGHNFAIISSILPHMGGYKVVNNFKADFENANLHLKDEFNAIFKNFRMFEGGAPSTAPAAAVAAASSK